MLLSQFPLTGLQTPKRMPHFITKLMTIFVLVGTFFERCFMEDIFELGISAADTEFCEQVQFGIVVHIPRHKYQVKPHSSPSFSVACRAAIAHRNHFFCLYKQNKRIEVQTVYPAGIYLLKVNNRNTRTSCEICSKLTINIPERC